MHYFWFGRMNVFSNDHYAVTKKQGRGNEAILWVHEFVHEKEK